MDNDSRMESKLDNIYRQIQLFFYSIFSSDAHAIFSLQFLLHAKSFTMSFFFCFSFTLSLCGIDTKLRSNEVSVTIFVFVSLILHAWMGPKEDCDFLIYFSIRNFKLHRILVMTLPISAIPSYFEHT